VTFEFSYLPRGELPRLMDNGQMKSAPVGDPDVVTSRWSKQALLTSKRGSDHCRMQVRSGCGVLPTHLLSMVVGGRVVCLNWEGQREAATKST
jgi:hypothetical protein